MARTPMIENMWDEYLELNGFLAEREKKPPEHSRQTIVRSYYMQATPTTLRSLLPLIPFSFFFSNSTSNISEYVQAILGFISPFSVSQTTRCSTVLYVRVEGKVRGGEQKPSKHFNDGDVLSVKSMG